jgi:hypothetical protein
VSTKLDRSSQIFSVEVVQSPVIKPFPEVQYVLAGGYFNLSCLATGMPEPTATWYGTEEQSLLIVDKVLKGTNETYICEAKNDHGISIRNIISIAIAPTTLITANESLIAREAGSSLVLECEASIDTALPTERVRRQWSKDGNNLDNVGEVLEVAWLQKDHSGMYACKISTGLEELMLVQKVKVAFETPLLDRTIPMKIEVLADTRLKLECSVLKGIPSPEVTWKFKPKNEETDRVYDGSVIEHASTSDEGIYTCLAVNEYGSDHIEVVVNVFEPAKFVIVPKDIVVSSLDRVSLDCTVRIDPRLLKQTKINWLLESQNLTVADGLDTDERDNSLVISNTMKRHQGSYTCVVENNYQSVNQTTRLTVLGEVPSFISTEKDVRALESTNLTISCQANGLPLPKIQWFRDDGKNIERDERFSKAFLGDLTIINVQMLDQRNYTCRASNVYGDIETVSSVEVIKKSGGGGLGEADAREVMRRSRQNVVLMCGVSYDPRVHEETKIVWDRDSVDVDLGDSKYLLMSDRSLKISNLSLFDRGLYTCEVSTPFETTSSKISLRVSGEPPKILSEFTKIVLYEGQALDLKCLVRGDPRPSLSWIFDGTPVPSKNVEELVTASPEFREAKVFVSAVSKANEGVYQCETSNVYGSGVAKFSKVQVITRTMVSIVKTGEKGGKKFEHFS